MEPPTKRIRNELSKLQETIESSCEIHEWNMVKMCESVKRIYDHTCEAAPRSWRSPELYRIVVVRDACRCVLIEKRNLPFYVASWLDACATGSGGQTHVTIRRFNTVRITRNAAFKRAWNSVIATLIRQHELDDDPSTCIANTDIRVCDHVRHVLLYHLVVFSVNKRPITPESDWCLKPHDRFVDFCSTQHEMTTLATTVESYSNASLVLSAMLAQDFDTNFHWGLAQDTCSGFELNHVVQTSGLEPRATVFVGASGDDDALCEQAFRNWTR